MPFLDAKALEVDPAGLSFLRAVLKPAPGEPKPVPPARLEPDPLTGQPCNVDTSGADPTRRAPAVVSDGEADVTSDEPEALPA